MGGGTFPLQIEIRVYVTRSI